MYRILLVLFLFSCNYEHTTHVIDQRKTEIYINGKSVSELCFVDCLSTDGRFQSYPCPCNDSIRPKKIYLSDYGGLVYKDSFYYKISK